MEKASDSSKRHHRPIRLPGQRRCCITCLLPLWEVCYAMMHLGFIALPVVRIPLIQPLMKRGSLGPPITCRPLAFVHRGSALTGNGCLSPSFSRKTLPTMHLGIWTSTCCPISPPALHVATCNVGLFSDQVDESVHLSWPLPMGHSGWLAQPSFQIRAAPFLAMISFGRFIQILLRWYLCWMTAQDSCVPGIQVHRLI